jgi:hypothetical protein
MYGHDIVTKRRSEQFGMDYFYNFEGQEVEGVDSADAFHLAALESVAGGSTVGWCRCTRTVRLVLGGMRTKGIRRSSRP